MSRKSALLFAALGILLSVAPAALAMTSQSLTLRVYSNGYVSVAQTLSVDPKSSSVQVPLLSPEVSGLVATDQNGTPLSYGFSPGGTNITIYTVGATSVHLYYDTDTLTGKNGTVWTLSFEARYNSTVILPQGSTLGSVSGTPYSINQTGGSPEMTLSAGAWRISYGVPLEAQTTSTSTFTSTTSGAPPGGAGLTFEEWEAVGVLAAAAVAAAAYLWWRSRRIGPSTEGLRPDDVQVLNFIQEKGGRVLEPEIRMKFALPKTSAWRQIKRLERLGYVKVTKIGSQNQIEIIRERKNGE